MMKIAFLLLISLFAFFGLVYSLFKFIDALLDGGKHEDDENEF